MDIKDKMFENATPCGSEGLCRIEQITPLAQQINCLDINRIADICVSRIPELVGAGRASLYILDEPSDMLHLQKNNHPFLINHIVSLNQTPPSPMVLAVRSKELILIDDIETHTKPFIRKSQRRFAANYKSGNCIFRAAIGGNHRHWRAWIVLDHMLQQAQTISIRQAHISQAQIIDLFAQVLLSQQGIGCGIGLQSHALQRQCQEFANVRLIVHHQNAARRHGSLTFRNGDLQLTAQYILPYYDL